MLVPLLDLRDTQRRLFIHPSETKLRPANKVQNKRILDARFTAYRSTSSRFKEEITHLKVEQSNWVGRLPVIDPIH